MEITNWKDDDFLMSIQILKDQMSKRKPLRMRITSNESIVIGNAPIRICDPISRVVEVESFSEGHHSSSSSSSLVSSVDALSLSSLATTSSSYSFSLSSHDSSIDTPPTSFKKSMYQVGSFKFDKDSESSDFKRISIQDMYDMRLISLNDFELEQAQPIVAPPNVIKSGILYLKRAKNSPVKSDYNFIVRPNMELQFSKADDLLDDEDVKRSKLILSACTLTPSETCEHEFELTYGLKRLYLGAQSVDIAKEWMSILDTSIRFAKELFYESVRFEGWLYKKGETIKNWKKRWCIMKEGVIYYYEDQFTALSSFHTNYKGKVDIADCWAALDDEKPNGFKIHTENRTWMFYSSTLDETMQWIKSIDEEKRERQLMTFTQDGRIVLHDQISTHKREIITVSDDIEADSVVTSYIDLKNVKEMVEPEQFRYVRWVLALLRHKVQERKHEQNVLDLVEAEVVSTPAPYSSPDIIIIRFHLDKTTLVKCKKESTLRHAISIALEKRSIEKDTDAFVGRIYDQEKYILDLDVPLWNLVYVRKMITKGKSPIDIYILDRDNVIAEKSSPMILSHTYSSVLTKKSNGLEKPQGISSNNKTIAKIRSAIRNGSFIGKEKGPSFFKSNIKSPFDEIESKSTKEEQEVIHIDDLPTHKFSIKVVSIEKFSYSLLESNEEFNLAKSDGKLYFYVEIGMYYGGKAIHEPMRTGRRLNTYWSELKETSIPLNRLPPETRINFTFYCYTLQKDIPIAWVNCTLTDFTGMLKSGAMELSMWLDKPQNIFGTTEVNPSRNLLLNVIFPEAQCPIVYPEFLTCPPILNKNIFSKDPSEQKKRLVESPLPEFELHHDVEDDQFPLNQIMKLSNLDPLYYLNSEEKELLWEHREYLKDKPALIPKLLLSADMANHEQRKIIHAMVREIPLISPERALELLDYKHPDLHVRSYAVRCLSKIDDTTLCLYLLQLVQVLKYESFHISELACFLLERALMSPQKIGYLLFWHLQSETHLSNVKARFKILQEALLMGIRPSFRTEIFSQLEFVKQITGINTEMSKIPPPERKKALQKMLLDIKLPDRFTLPLDPSIILEKIVIEKCKIMESAARPMLLVFKNAEAHGEDYSVLCKFGDDLRQDALTLQMFTLMDRIWKENDLDLQMSIYKCVSTGRNMGLIEVLPDCETTAKIQKDAGGVIGAFKQTPLHNWLRSFNSADTSWADAVEVFTRSCAACCVSTYVIGIGDRHNDNIMVTKSGGLFHIDFAHFLGNIMKFGVYKREKAPFVMTSEFAYVMGGEKSDQYKKFETFCTTSYNYLRKHSSTFISLFGLMLFAGIPQLSSPNDLEYLRKSLAIGLTDEEASKHFSKLIDESLKAKSTQINFAIHIFANPD